MSSNEAVRRSTSATLDEIVATEKALKNQGTDATDLGDWEELGEIVARIERKLANRKENAA